MKKLMFAAVAMAACVAFAETSEIASQNIVGYAQGVITVQGFNFINISFDDIGTNTRDIQDIRISDGGQGTIGWGVETFAIWAGGPDVVEGSGFFYYDKSIDPNKEATDYYWGDSDGYAVTYSVMAGQSVVIDCNAGLAITTKGQVPTGDVEGLVTVQGFNFFGNPFPMAMDIQGIRISDGGQGTIGWGVETFALWAGGPDVVEGSGFFYYDKSIDPNKEATDYYWGDSDGYAVTYPIAIGQGAVIDCNAGLEVTLKMPYTLGE